MQMQEVIEKLKDILASEGKCNLKTKDIAKELGIHPDTFNSMKFRNSIPYPQILNFLNQRNISINYFFYGSSPKDQLECENKYKILKLYKTNASLGGGGINDLIDSSDLIIDEKVLNFFGSKECEFITCYGESMEPIIKDGSICVIDRNKTFKNKSICVINTRDGLFIKQVLKQDDGVILHSLNPLYEDIFYKNGDFLLIGVVIGTFKTMTAHNKLSQANLVSSIQKDIKMDRVSADIRQGVNKRFINAICNHNNELVLEYLKNGMSVTKECMGKEPMFYAVTHNNFGAILLLLKYGAILDKEYLEESNKNFSKEALEFLASLL